SPFDLRGSALLRPPAPPARFVRGLTRRLSRRLVRGLARSLRRLVRQARGADELPGAVPADLQLGIAGGGVLEVAQRGEGPLHGARPLAVAAHDLERGERAEALGDDAEKGLAATVARQLEAHAAAGGVALDLHVGDGVGAVDDEPLAGPLVAMARRDD